MKKLNLRLDIGGGHVGEILIEVKGIRSASISGVRTAIFARKCFNLVILRIEKLHFSILLFLFWFLIAETTFAHFSNRVIRYF